MAEIVKIVICSGTTCYVMGGSELLLLEDHIPAKWRHSVDISGATCLGICKDRKYGKAPYVLVDDEVLAEATVPLVLQKISEKLGVQRCTTTITQLS